jgi:hypothetical protein
VGLQRLENQALSWGIIGKSASILAAITMQKSQLQTLKTSPAMRQISPALLPSQLAVLHTTVPMQTGSLAGQSTLKGIQATSSRHSPTQIVPASVSASRLAMQEKTGQTPVDKQQCLKHSLDWSQGTLGWPTGKGHIDWGQVRVTFRSRTNPASTRPATRFIRMGLHFSFANAQTRLSKIQ